MILLCFAVKEEAAPFAREAGSRAEVKILLTGMGRTNAEKAIRNALRKERPELVVSAGFAGGLRPELPAGSVLFAADPEANWDAVLQAAGARPARFHCAGRIAATAAEKRHLWEATGADAVEMESEILREVCRNEGIPSATVRVILDLAAEDLPLDFNTLLTADFRIDALKLTLALVQSPLKMRALWRFRKQSQAAAQRLAHVLQRIVAGKSAPHSN